MPFGLPVVPEEYSIAAPSNSSGIGVVGWRSVASPRFLIRSPWLGPSTIKQSSIFGHAAIAASATPRRASDVISTLDRLLLTIYASSPAVRNEFTLVK